MDVLLLCGYFEPKYQEEITRKTKTWVENAANTFQQRLIAGLREQEINLKVVSAPFIGPWPGRILTKLSRALKPERVRKMYNMSILITFGAIEISAEPQC